VHIAAQSRPTGAAAAVAGPSHAAVYVVAGPGAGQTLPLSHGFTIGSARNCHLVLDADPAAAAHHAQIVMDTAGNCTLVDRGSQTGTFVNGVRSQQMQLKHGMLIKIGACQLRFMKQ
jgi:pSer/pThr/pTyr-binding forkhead associated (FHA) protein